MNFPYPYHWISGQDGAIVDAVRLHGDVMWWRSAAFVGAANGKKGILSVWFKFARPDWNGYDMRMFGSSPDNMTLLRGADNKLRFYLYDAAGSTAVFDIRINATNAADATWHHFLASWDAAITTVQVYIDDVAAPFTYVGGPSNTTIPYNQGNHLFGKNWNATLPWDGELSEFYFNMATNLDLSVTANRRKFITASKRPVGLGPTGALPTGTAPIWMHSGNETTFSTNKGTGGPITDGVVGTMYAPSNTPSTIYNPFTKLLLHCDGFPGTVAGIYDSSGPVGHFIGPGGATLTTAGSKFGNTSLSFTAASSQYIYLDGSSDFAFGTGDFTIDFWMNYGGTGNTYSLIDFRPGVEGPYPSLWLTSAGVIGYWANSLYRITGTTVLAQNTWYHIALTRAGTTLRLFVNGVLDGSVSDGNNYFAGASRPIIGCAGLASAGPNYFYYNGWKDEIRILKGQAAWTANFTPPTAPYAN